MYDACQTSAMEDAPLPLGKEGAMTIKYDNLVLKKLNYNSYLKIPDLLELQQPISDPVHHDEMFFIIIHQAAELWFKNIMHEVEKVVDGFREPMISRALKGFKRVTAITDLLVKQINLLSTLTPVEFAGFRDNLNPASGFQSFQFRKMEYLFGVRDAFFLKFFESMPERVAELEEIRNQPTVYDEFWKCLKETAKVDLPDSFLQRDCTKNHELNEDLVQVILNIYENPGENYHFCLLFEAMLDFDEKFSLFRSTHMLMVERTIGHKKGTGGSAGYKFLQSRAHLKFFPELWDVRNHIGKVGY